MLSALIDLCSIPGMTQARLRNLLVQFRSPDAIFEASEADLRATKGIGPELARLISNYRRTSQTQARIARARELNCQAVTFLDSAYPANLREINNPPPVLFMRGTIQEQDRVAVAIIGTRRATPYGTMVAQRFARGLAEHNVTVVSGLARGIDTAAHCGALAGKGRTIAVLGCGVDVYYPPENRHYYDQIAEHGAVISEFNLGTGPDAFHFPIRNRIISGLARAVLAVEARDSSGVLNTVRWAADQGREVMAVPGVITAETSYGTNELIKDGARAVTSLDDLLDVLKISRRQVEIAQNQRAATEQDQALLRQLSDDPVHIDDLAAKTGQSVPQLLGRLLELEMMGLVRQLPGMQFVLELGTDDQTKPSGQRP
ncbi:MAG: DNA-processing protein DprA [candidate division WOR-3 bacterium]